MNLQLSLKTKWFEMTNSLIKKEDYREVNSYWIKRLFKKTKLQDGSIAYINLKKFTQNTMTLGYPKKGDTERIIQFEHAGIEIRTGKPEWGAEPDKLYFVIKHGKKL